MNWDEYNKLFHRAQVNRVAFVPVMQADEPLLRMVNLALDDQRELIAAWVVDMCQGLDASTIAEAIRNGGNDEMDNFKVTK
jgi:hypothetical protein